MATKDKLKDVFGPIGIPSMFAGATPMEGDTVWNSPTTQAGEFIPGLGDYINNLYTRERITPSTPEPKELNPMENRPKVGSERGVGGRPTRSLMRKAKKNAYN